MGKIDLSQLQNLLANHGTGSITINDATITSSITLDPNQKVTLTDSQNTGNINRLITLKSTFDVDRPWISWVDENNRHRVSMGYHTKLIQSLGGDTLIQYEIKTIASSTGPDPTDMRTRFTVGTDAQRVKVGVVYADTFEFYQGENPVTLGEGVKTFSIDYRAVAQDTFNGANWKIASFGAQVDASDNAIFFIDVNPPYTSGGSLFPGNKLSTLTFFRNTNVAQSTGPQIKVKLGDGSNTDSLTFSAKTGTLAISGPLGINGSTPPAKPTVTGAKGSNAALASLLTALVSYGFITDSTTA